MYIDLKTSKACALTIVVADDSVHEPVILPGSVVVEVGTFEFHIPVGHRKTIRVPFAAYNMSRVGEGRYRIEESTAGGS